MKKINEMVDELVQKTMDSMTLRDLLDYVTEMEYSAYEGFMDEEVIEEYKERIGGEENESFFN